MDTWERQAVIDDEHLKLLPLFYWVQGGLDVFFSLYGWFYVLYGFFFLLIPFEPNAGAPDEFPAFFAWFFFAIGGAIIVLMGVSAALKILAGFWIRSRRRRGAIYVAAALSCLFIPYGTVVGVLTFIVLSRPSVSAQFERAREQFAASAVPEEGSDVQTG